jgi:ribosomal protein S18 acetylase RimI-like enzyme
MELRLTMRDLEPRDLSDLDWSGGSAHIRAVAAALQDSYTGEVAVVVLALANERLVGLGGVDFRPEPGCGRLWMLAVHHRLQSLGLGTRLIAALEDRIVAYGRSRARLSVELDNPRARELYQRLGYRELGPVRESWPLDDGGTYAAACTLMERDLSAGPRGDGRSRGARD